MSEWKKYRIGEIVGINLRTYSAKQNWDFAYYLDTGSITENSIDSISYISNMKDAPSRAKRIVSKGDIIYSMVRPNQKHYGFISDMPEFFLVSTGFIVISVHEEIIDSKYLYYFLTQQTIIDYLQTIAEQSVSAYPSIKPIDLENLCISLPSLPEQKRIAGILSALDDKIELNRRINANLEAQAMALYKQWFVDFEFPNSAEKPYKSSGGKMIDSDFGPIPSGWHKGTLSEIGNVIGGGTPSKENTSYYTESGIAWITPKDLSISHNKFISKGANDITELGYRSSSAKLMPKGTILFSSRAPIGYMAIAKNEVCTNQGFKSIIPQKHTAAFIYYFLKTNVEKIESQASGSTFKEASGTLMKSLEILVPDSECLQSFDTIMSQLFNMQESNEEEIQTLSTLRDILLPKLISNT